MRPSNPVPAALSRTRSSLELLLAGLRWLLTRLVAGVHRAGVGVVALVHGPIARLVRGPVRTVLVGRRVGVSVLVVAVAPVLAALTAGVVATTTGYPPLERWLVGTWTGADPRAAVFVGAALLVGLAAASAARNGGLLPTAALVAAPLFGVAITRYGTTVTTRVGERVVSLPDALAFAFGVAAVGGVVVGVAGYGVGAGCRRAGRVVRADVPNPFDGSDTDGCNDD
jgi:hypothetical protein